MSARADEYQRSGSTVIGDRIVREMTPLVYAIANRVAARLPEAAFLEPEDLRQAGSVGLLQAMRSFDIERGVRFEAYAGLRIEGAMLDTLRGEDPLPRRKREALREIAGARDELRKSGFAHPSDEEVLALTSFSGDEYRKYIRFEMGLQTVSLDEHSHLSDSASVSGTHGTVPSASDVALRREFWEQIEKRLEPNEARVLLGTTVHGESPDDLAHQLGISRSRVNGLKHAAVERLRETFLQPVTGSSFIAAVREKWAPVTES